MARITIEDCTERVPNRFHLVQMAAIRTKQLKKGARALVQTEREQGGRDRAARDRGRLHPARLRADRGGGSAGAASQRRPSLAQRDHLHRDRGR